MITAQLRALVRHRYAGSGWAVFDEVRNETGWSFGKPTRSADMLAMGLWRSKGLELHGFELKVSRADWLRELRSPADKSEAVAKYLDRWWLVAAPDVARQDELPTGWGMLVADDTLVQLVVARPAPLRTAAPLDRLFVASLVRQIAARKFTVDAVREGCA